MGATVPPALRGLGGSSSAGTAPARRTSHSPASSKRRRSITVDGVPGSSPASRTRSAPLADRLRHVLQRAARRAPPASVGRALQHRARPTPRSSGTSGTRRPSAVAARERVAPARVRQQQRHPAGQQPRHQRARARAQLGQRGDRELGVEEHHRARLARRPPLERVHPLDRRGALGVAREPVDGVGREHRHAARGDAAPRSVTSDAADDDPLVAGEVAHELDVPRGHERGDRSGLPGADLQREERDAVAAGDQPADDVEPVVAAEQRLARLEARRRAAAGRRRRRRAGWRRRRRRSPAGRAGRRGANSTSSPSRSAFARATSRAPAEMSVPTTARSGRSSFSASAIAPEPVPTSATRAPSGSDSAASTTCSVSGRGTSTRGSTASSIVRKPFSPRM